MLQCCAALTGMHIFLKSRLLGRIHHLKMEYHTPSMVRASMLSSFTKCSSIIGWLSKELETMLQKRWVRMLQYKWILRFSLSGESGLHIHLLPHLLSTTSKNGWQMKDYKSKMVSYPATIYKTVLLQLGMTQSPKAVQPQVQTLRHLCLCQLTFCRPYRGMELSTL